MRWTIKTCLTLGLAAGAVHAGMPAMDMGPRVLGAGYMLGYRGQTITAAGVNSHETMHHLMLGYAPVEYALVNLGLGVDRFRTDRHLDSRFRGGYGFSPAFGLHLSSPGLIRGELLRAQAGGWGQYFRSDDGRGVTYNVVLVSPYAGVLVSPIAYLDVGAGVKLHQMDGIISQRETEDELFGNRQLLRAYGSIVVKNPHEGAFVSLDFDASPDTDNDWSNGPVEASVGISVGTMIKWKPRKLAKPTGRPYFNDYPKIKKVQEEIAEDLH